MGFGFNGGAISDNGGVRFGHHNLLVACALRYQMAGRNAWGTGKMSELKKGIKALWIPGKPRKGSYGAAWGTMPVEVEIIRGPTHGDRYDCRVLDKKLLPNTKHLSRIRSIHLITNYEVRT